MPADAFDEAQRLRDEYRKTGPEARPLNLAALLRRAEDGGCSSRPSAFATLLPLVDAVGRPLGGFHVPGSAAYVQQLTLWLAFVGGLLATRERKHLTLSTAEFLGEGRLETRRPPRGHHGAGGRGGGGAGLRQRRAGGEPTGSRPRSCPAASRRG